jgi:hypothetical protein
MTAHRRHWLERTGEALYGARWQSELARDLDIADRTMRRWLGDPDTIPETIWPELLKLLAARAASIAKLQRQLKNMSK